MSLPKCACGKQLSRKEYTRCKPCFGKLRLGKFIKPEVKYYAVHRYLRTVYGSANHCEGTNCLRQSSSFEWALIAGMKHERKRENYMQLCKQCHNIYDKIYDGRLRNLYGHFI